MIINNPLINQYDTRRFNRWRLFYESDSTSKLKSSHWFGN